MIMRLIDADKFKKSVMDCDLWYENADVWVVVDLIDEAPTVEERKYGLWLIKPLAGRSTVRCSCCRTVFRENSGKWTYCPYCGAKMDGDK